MPFEDTGNRKSLWTDPMRGCIATAPTSKRLRKTQHYQSKALRYRPLGAPSLRIPRSPPKGPRLKGPHFKRNLKGPHLKGSHFKRNLKGPHLKGLHFKRNLKGLHLKGPLFKRNLTRQDIKDHEKQPYKDLILESTQCIFIYIYIYTLYVQLQHA